MADDDKITSDIDDWLSDLEEDEGAGADLDQADIDKLLGGDLETETGEGAPPSPPPDGVPGEGGPPPPATAAAAEEPEGSPPPAKDDDEVSAADLDQSEIDELFAAAHEEPPEEVDIEQLLGAETETEGAPADDLHLDTQTGAATPAEEPPPSPPPPPEPPEAGGPPEAMPEPPPEPAPAPAAEATGPAAATTDRKRWLLAAAVILGLLFLAAGGLLWWRRTPPVAEPPAQTAEVAEPAPPAPAVNHPPLALTRVLRLEDVKAPLTVHLAGHDPDGDPLQFTLLSPPAHGTLAGTPPDLTYQAAEDFSGEDSFAFAVNDASQASEPATVYILGPRPATKPEKRKVTSPPVVPLAAVDHRVEAVAATDVLIDWRAVWARANRGPMKATVEVLTPDDRLRGRLIALAPTAARYLPPPFTPEVDEVIAYRFADGKRRSPTALLHLHVRQADQPPQVALADLAPAYPVGDTVILDTRASRDEDPDSLTFTWRQLAGPPVVLEQQDQHGGVISFVMPAGWDGGDPLVVLEVTARDSLGQEGRRTLRIQGRSRVTAPLRDLAAIGDR